MPKPLYRGMCKDGYLHTDDGKPAKTEKQLQGIYYEY